MSKCNDCPIIPESEHAFQIDSYGCLPSAADALKWYNDTGKAWACHARPTKVCGGLVRLLKANNIPYIPKLPLITEQTTLEEIYEDNE